MTRLFACITNQPQRLGEALAPVRAALVAREPVARWGVGYVQSGEVLLSLHPRVVVGPLDFYPVVSGLASDYVVGAADVDDGLRGQLNTQPFRFRRWLFAQENRAAEVDAADAGDDAVTAEIAGLVPDFLRRNLRGRTREELFFHVFLAALHGGGELDDPNLDPRQIRRALRDTAATVGAAATRAGAAPGIAARNLVITNSRSLVALRLGGPMFVRRLKQQTDPRRPESQFRSVLVVSADAAPGEGFEELAPRSAVTVARDVSADLSALDG